jgi:hypothetical protein
MNTDNNKLPDVVIAANEAHRVAKSNGHVKGKGGDGTLPCPICKTGTLHYSVAAYNGHLWGTCTTKDCVRWME